MAMDYLVLREKLKQELRSKLGCTQTSTDVVSNDGYGSFFGPSETVFSGRVMQEIKSLLENPPAEEKTGEPSRESEKKERIRKMKESRDYSCLLSEEPVSGVKDVPAESVPEVEVGSVPVVKRLRTHADESKKEDMMTKVAKKLSDMTSPLSREELKKIRKSRNYSFLNEEGEPKKGNVSRTPEGFIKKEGVTKKGKVSGTTKQLIRKEGLTKKENVSGTTKQLVKKEGLTKKENVSGTTKQLIKKEGLTEKENVSGTKKQLIKKKEPTEKVNVSGTEKQLIKKDKLTGKESVSGTKKRLIKNEDLKEKENVSGTKKRLIKNEDLTEKENVSGTKKRLIKNKDLSEKESVSGTNKRLTKDEDLTEKENVSGTKKLLTKDEDLTEKENVSGTKKRLTKEEDVSGMAEGSNKKEGLTKETVKKENTSRVREGLIEKEERVQEGLIKKERLTNTTVKNVRPSTARREGSENRDMKKTQGEQRRIREPVKENLQLKTGKAKPKTQKRKACEIEDEEEDPIAMIRRMMRYDPTKYRDARDDDMMVASFADVEREERRSAKLARVEDKKALAEGATRC